MFKNHKFLPLNVLVAFLAILIASEGFASNQNPGQIPIAIKKSEKPVTQPEGDDPARYYEDRERGWDWYETPPIETPESESEKAKQAVPQPVPPDTPLTKENLDKMSAPQLRALVDATKDEAIAFPTRSNVFRYVYVQKYVTDKSLQFSDMWQAVILEHPELTYMQRNSQSAIGIDTMREDMDKQKKAAIQDLSEQAGLLLFYSEECPYCEKFEPVIKMFEKQYGWFVKRIEISKNPDLADAFFVESTPDLWLIYKNEDGTPFYHRVKSGLAAASEIEDSLEFILRFVVPNKELNPHYQPPTDTASKTVAPVKRSESSKRSTPR